MPKETLTLKIRADGVREALAAFRALPKEASVQLRDASERIAASLADAARSASHIDAQAAAVGTTVRVARDRVPAVQVGGSKPVTSSRVPAYKLLFGSEFGANGRFGWYAHPRYADSTGRQFKPHQGTEGRWFFPTAEAEIPDAMVEWNKAVDGIVAFWASHGGGS